MEKKKIIIITCIPVIIVMYHSIIHHFQSCPFQKNDKREQIGVFPLDLVASFGECSTVNVPVLLLGVAIVLVISLCYHIISV